MTNRPIARPFIGIRYRQPDLSRILAPPYDIITPAEQERLHQCDPGNVVRLELGYGDTDQADSGPLDAAGGHEPVVPALPRQDRYARSGATLRQWLDQGILAYDDEPCIYPYAQSFGARGERRTRVGVLCAVRLTPFEEGVVLPHEGTLAAPRADRRRLMLACQAQISPLLALHDDPRGEIARAIAEMMAKPPVATGQTNDEEHRLWRLGGAAAEKYCQALGQGPLYIADGHHRYETALTVSREMRVAHPEAPPNAAFNYVLSLLCPAAQPGVVILPTHRLLRLEDGQQRARLESLIGERFERQAVNCPVGQAVDAARELAASLGSSPGVGRFGMYARPGGCSLLAAKPDALPSDPGPGGINHLDTVLIHWLLIDPLLGENALGRRVAYVMDEAEAVQRVDAGEAACALFLRPTTVEQVKRVAAAGLRMPGKSTYFYPKAPTGLVIADISPTRTVG